ncbi:hypothetical protein FNV43_RR05360 [Rhamnella rubrinervis]|uniref:NAC domain-containing protein n=1 Tax=Rhamnella rubrinervis TaxID=2594499 RepID=A0A8K0MQK8_9ROSA|nr:hypothetical protein FNV43_RR05360 [Rhamnella rubrinervis]
MALLKKGFKFLPSDEQLVQLLYEKIVYGYDHSHEVPLMEYDLYGPQEPSNVWKIFGGDRFDEGSNEDLYFLTKLKKVCVTSSRINRSVGSGGTWSAAYSREFSTRSRISQDAPVITAKKTHLRYENEGSLDHGAWIMHEFCLGNINDRGRFCRYDDPYVICRLRKSKMGRNQKKLCMESVRDRDHQPNVITKKPRLLEHGRYEEGLVEYSRMGSTGTVQPQIDEVLEARNMSNNSSEFTSSIHGINGSSMSFSEDVDGINIVINDHVVVQEHSNPCTTTDKGVLTNYSTTSAETLMSFDVDVFQFDNLCARYDDQNYNVHSVKDHNDQPNVITKEPRLYERGYEEGVEYSRMDARNLSNNSSELTTSIQGIDVTIIQDDHAVVEAETLPMSFDDHAFKYDNLCAWEKCTNLDEGVSGIDADGILKYVLDDDDDVGINVENDHVVVEEHNNICATVDQGLLTNSSSAQTPMSFDANVFDDNLRFWIDQMFPEEADNAILEYKEEDHHVAVAGGNDLTPIIIDNHAAVPETNNVQQPSTGAFHEF